MFLCILGVEPPQDNYSEPMVWIGSSMVVRGKLLKRHLFCNYVANLTNESIQSVFIIHQVVLNYSLKHLFN